MGLEIKFLPVRAFWGIFGAHCINYVNAHLTATINQAAPNLFTYRKRGKWRHSFLKMDTQNHEQQLILYRHL